MIFAVSLGSFMSELASTDRWLKAVPGEAAKEDEDTGEAHSYKSGRRRRTELEFRVLLVPGQSCAMQAYPGIGS